MPNSNLTKIKQLLTAVTILALCPLPTNATILEQDLLELPTNIVRERLIVEGMTAYRAGYHAEAVYLLRNFLNPHRIITTPLEKSGINCLALAFQALDQSDRATETIERAISVANNSPLELAASEYNAGVIAARQSQLSIANRHWETARQLYQSQNRDLEWAKATLKLAQSYRLLGNLPKSRQLLQELKK